MPLYLCACNTKDISTSDKQKISKLITEVHCHATGAPPSFVHVFFLDKEIIPMLQLLWESDGSPTPIQVYGNIRAGRPEEIKTTLISGIKHGVAEILRIALSDVSMATKDVEAKWVMEGGSILPEPGEETDWLAAH